MRLDIDRVAESRMDSWEDTVNLDLGPERAGDLRCQGTSALQHTLIGVSRGNSRRDENVNVGFGFQPRTKLEFGRAFSPDLHPQHGSKWIFSRFSEFSPRRGI